MSSEHTARWRPTLLVLLFAACAVALAAGCDGDRPARVDVTLMDAYDAWKGGSTFHVWGSRKSPDPRYSARLFEILHHLPYHFMAIPLPHAKFIEHVDGMFAIRQGRWKLI